MIGFPVKFETVFQGALDAHNSRRIIAETFEHLGWKFSVTDQGIFQGKVGLTGMSWGETVTVEVSPENLVRIESRCGFQIIDWGKNKANVLKFINRFQQNEASRRNIAAGSASPEFATDGTSRVERLFAGEQR